MLFEACIQMRILYYSGVLLLKRGSITIKRPWSTEIRCLKLLHKLVELLTFSHIILCVLIQYCIEYLLWSNIWQFLYCYRLACRQPTCLFSKFHKAVNEDKNTKQKVQIFLQKWSVITFEIFLNLWRLWLR